MYRPNRIGSHMLANLEAVPLVIAAATISSAEEAYPGVGAVVPDINVANDVRAESIVSDGSISLAVDASVAIGVLISGRKLHNSAEYLLEFGGTLSASGVTDVAATAIIGQADFAGAAIKALDAWCLVPNKSIEAPDSANDLLITSAEGCAILGDWTPSDTVTESELFFGFMLSNVGAGPAGIDNLRVSASIYRYASDLKPFDPNR